MGQIVASYDLMPESTEVPLEAVIKEVSKVLPPGVKLLESKIEPVAFGLKKVVIGVMIDDSKETIGSDLETALAEIAGVENIECTSTTVL